ncbi:helix-turn-helix domain-containing protein [Devosia riboflavina]|uniref:helix-turn-helix domain-containing protein n=1 Tax=Devosia riboflavina TaxID=46914 RepID=UPI00068DCE2A|nr:helix-turn-helix domain-containing protein [Devosia riboflavina]
MTEATASPADRVPSYAFSTAAVEARHQFDAWVSIMRPLVAMEPKTPHDKGFRAQSLAWDMGALALTHTVMPALDFRRDTSRLRADAVDHWLLVAPRRGVMRSEAGHRAGAGLCYVRSMHRISAGSTTDFDAVALVVPRDFCPAGAQGLDALHERHVASQLGGLLADYLHSLRRQLPRLSADHLPAVATATRAMLVACTAPGRDALAEAMPALQATQLERAKRLIRQNLLSPRLTVRELCRQLGMSRTALYRLFEPMGGVVQYIRLARLQDAHRALSSGADMRPIHEIAAERGFLEPSEFSRAFRRQFGYSPSEARHEGRSIPSRSPGPPTASITNIAEILAALA